MIPIGPKPIKDFPKFVLVVRPTWFRSCSNKLKTKKIEKFDSNCLQRTLINSAKELFSSSTVQQLYSKAMSKTGLKLVNMGNARGDRKHLEPESSRRKRKKLNLLSPNLVQVAAGEQNYIYFLIIYMQSLFFIHHSVVLFIY